ncbi:MAG: MGMT family protein [Planctomycetota bacterium]
MSAQSQHELPDDFSESAVAIATVMSQIPFGSVATYGQIAALAGYPKNARQVGGLLRKLPPGSGIPWYRVVNCKGEISPRKPAGCAQNQIEILKDEGVEFENGKIDLSKYRWEP